MVPPQRGSWLECNNFEESTVNKILRLHNGHELGYWMPKERETKSEGEYPFLYMLVRGTWERED